MGYNIENGETRVLNFKKLEDKILVETLEKGRQIAKKCNQSRQSQSNTSVRECSYQSLEFSRLYLRKLAPYLDNPYEEVLPESSQIKEKHETIKLLNEEVRMLQQKHVNLDNELTRPVHEKNF